MDGSITKKDESLFTYTHKGDTSICILDWTVETVPQTTLHCCSSQKDAILREQIFKTTNNYKYNACCVIKNMIFNLGEY